MGGDRGLKIAYLGHPHEVALSVTPNTYHWKDVVKTVLRISLS